MNWAIVRILGDSEEHIIPLEDLRDHDCSGECWCKPEEDDEDPLWVHKSMDGREAFEEGRRMPS